MRRIRLDIEYDGSDFHGWQWQSEERSVQGVVETALENLIGMPVRVHGAGRTDAGVHAEQMVAHFDTPVNFPLPAYREGLNSLLPEDVAIRSAMVVSTDFHARFSACSKWYRYSLELDRLRHPLSRRRRWLVKQDLDLGQVRAAARLFVGEHDFVRFRTSGCAAKTTVRRIDSLKVNREGQSVTFDVCGNGFLRQMVRRISGCLVDAGCGRVSQEVIRALLAAKETRYEPLTAPAHGLCLMEVRYSVPAEGTVGEPPL